MNSGADELLEQEEGEDDDDEEWICFHMPSLLVSRSSTSSQMVPTKLTTVNDATSPCETQRIGRQCHIKECDKC